MMPYSSTIKEEEHLLLSVGHNKINSVESSELVKREKLPPSVHNKSALTSRARAAKTGILGRRKKAA